MLILILFIGTRHEVGGDWSLYLQQFNEFKSTDNFFKEFNTTDYGYEILSGTISILGFEIYTLNLICGLFFIVCLSSYARRQNYPLLVIIIAVPYVINVLGMGYVRQGIAFAFALLAINALIKEKKIIFFMWLFFGVLFHKSVILMGALIIVSMPKISIRYYILSAIVFYLMFILVQKDLIRLFTYYVGEERHLYSSGTLFRVILNIIPAIIFIIYGKRMTNNIIERKIYLFMSLVSIASLFFVNYASTGVDRIMLYFIPLQLFVFSNLSLISKNNSLIFPINLIVISFYTLVLYVWLNYALFSNKWVPYQTYLF
tara:strand:+ start:7349 stop:8293 length:945 start_codon:yes stop_codon:yes gene_type:complete